MLRRIIRGEGEALTNGIIFCNRKVDVDILAKSLKRHGFDAEAMHGDLDQKLRMKILQAFRDGELKLLIASDVAARGLDIPNVSHIFNFDVPIHSEDYVHRIGRTGRAGRSGKSITLCLPYEEKYLAKIEELVKKAIPPMESPLEGRRARRGLHAARARPAAGGGPTAAAAAEPTAGRAEPRPEPRAEARSEPRARAAAAAPAPSAPRAASAAPAATRVPGMGDHVPAFLLRELRVGPAEPDEPRPSRSRAGRGGGRAAAQAARIAARSPDAKAADDEARPPPPEPLRLARTKARLGLVG